MGVVGVYYYLVHTLGLYSFGAYTFTVLTGTAAAHGVLSRRENSFRLESNSKGCKYKSFVMSLSCGWRKMAITGAAGI